MSGIAGILNFDGRPVAKGDLAEMTATMACRGPDGTAQWASGAVGLGHCTLKTTPQSLSEAQPLRSAPGDICLTMDGRLDNRHELAAALGEAGLAGDGTSDAELVVRAYRRWGTGCVPRLLGDFAFGLWDGESRRLVCARDFLGKRPFYYSVNSTSFRFGSEPRAVLADPSVPREPNEGMVAEFLSVGVASTTETLFRHLFRLPPAHLMVVTAAGDVKVSRYWDWDPQAEIRYRTDEEYADHLLDVAAAAAEARLRSRAPVAVALSGGVDSSSVLGLVRHLRQQHRHDGDVEVFSMAYPGRPCDESGYVQALADDHGLHVHVYEPGAVGAAPYEAQARRYLDLPDYPMTMMHRSYWADAAGFGCRVLMTGQGPDEWLTGSAVSLADRLRRARLGGLGRVIRADAGSSDSRVMAAHLWRYGVRPLLPLGVVEPLRAMTGRTRCPAFLQRSFCQEAGLDDRLRSPSRRAPSFASAAVAAAASAGWQAHANEMADRAAASAGLECRTPFDDRRVVEFALAIPEEQRRRGNRTKHVLRGAMAGLVPLPILARLDKADYSHLIGEELRLQGGPALFSDLEVVRRGWVDGPMVRDMYDHFAIHYEAGDPAFHRHLWALWMTTAVERWLRVL